jgi:outer membrane protein TolC
MDRASDDLADARLEYAIAESNLAIARAELTRAERRFHEVWGKALARYDIPTTLSGEIAG